MTILWLYWVKSNAELNLILHISLTFLKYCFSEITHAFVTHIIFLMDDTALDIIREGKSCGAQSPGEQIDFVAAAVKSPETHLCFLCTPVAPPHALLWHSTPESFLVSTECMSYIASLEATLNQ